MKPFFSEADCDMSGRDAMYMKCISLEKANRLIQERSKVVYGLKHNGHWSSVKPHTADCNIEKALLIAIEPIEQDSALKFVRDWLAEYGNYSYEEMQKRAKALLEKGEGK